MYYLFVNNEYFCYFCLPLVPFSSLILLKSYQPGFCEAALTDPDNAIVAWFRSFIYVNHTTVDLYVVRRGDALCI